LHRQQKRLAVAASLSAILALNAPVDIRSDYSHLTDVDRRAGDLNELPSAPAALAGFLAAS
jgi:hypothetical protein